MKREILHHLAAYTILAAGLLCFVTLFFWFWPDRVSLYWLTVGLMLFYTGWGIVTHTKTDHLTRRVVLEYSAVALVAGMMLLLITA